jgi:CRISPR-associated protein Csm1
MASSQQRDQLYLAALLHDIGKFYQRADPTGYRRSSLLGNETKELISVLCPYNNRFNDWTHKHVLWTFQYFEDFRNKFNEVLDNEGYGRDQAREGLARLSAAHHNPQGIQEKLLQKADHMSSGVDRTQGVGIEDAEEELNLPAYKAKRMRSIFESLKRENEDFTWRHHLPVTSLKLNNEFFPQLQEEFDQAPDYHTNWQEFINNTQHLPTGNFGAFAESLRSLLEAYTANIPSSTQHLADVSLYDHLKTTAAIALCLHDYFEAKNELQQIDLEQDEEPLLLIGGDVSGVQRFIYDIISRNAAKNLKGRSFYLQVLVDSIVQRLLKAFGLYASNIVYSSGGMFFVLAPNTTLVKEELKRQEEEIGKHLFDNHQTSLYVALDQVGVSQQVILENADHEHQLSDQWQALINKLNQKKQKRHKQQIQENYEQFFMPMEQGGLQQRDAITQEEVRTATRTITDGNNQKQIVSPATYEQIEMGEALRNTQEWVMATEDWRSSYSYLRPYTYQPAELGVYHYFLPDNVAPPDQKGGRTLHFNLKRQLLSGQARQLAQGFEFYGGNQYPTDEEGEPQNFNELAGPEELSFRRLGVLRMDVDDLGQAFVSGFQRGRRTFSRYSTLSRNLDYFFKGYLNKLWEDVEVYRKYTYIIYSGGDDLFIVGKWDVLIGFAEDIHHAFNNWTCQNPEISLSGGMAMVNLKFPIAKSAELAAEGEEQAKEHQVPLSNADSEEKNAFTLFHYPLNWNYEFPKVKALKNEIKELANRTDYPLPKAFFSKIQTYHEASQDQKQKGRVESWRWLMAYDLSRMKERLKGDEVQNFLERTKMDVFSNTWHGKNQLYSAYPFLTLLTIATRWADLEMR